MGCCDGNAEIKHEENTERRCTDVFWLCLYIAFWFLMVILLQFLNNESLFIYS